MGKSKIKNQKSKMQFKIQNFSYFWCNPIKTGKFWFVILIFAFCILHFIGCATLKKASEGIKETAKGIIGISTKQIEETRNSALIKTFTCDYQTCYSRVNKILKYLGAYVYAQDKKKNLIAVYISEIDTTPVGIFFKVIDSSRTQIEISSPSTQAKELIAKGVFSSLEKSFQVEQKKEESNEKK